MQQQKPTTSLAHRFNEVRLMFIKNNKPECVTVKDLLGYFKMHGIPCSKPYIKAYVEAGFLKKADTDMYVFTTDPVMETKLMPIVLACKKMIGQARINAHNKPATPVVDTSAIAAVVKKFGVRTVAKYLKEVHNCKVSIPIVVTNYEEL